MTRLPAQSAYCSDLRLCYPALSSSMLLADGGCCLHYCQQCLPLLCSRIPRVAVGSLTFFVRLCPPRPTKVKPPRRNPSSGTGPGKPRARVHDRTCAVPGRQSVGTNSGFRLRAANASQLAFSLTRTLSSPSPRLPAAPRLRRTGRRAGRGERGKGGRDALHRRVKIAPLQHWRTSRQWHITEHGRNRQCSCGHAPPARLAFAGTHDDT